MVRNVYDVNRALFWRNMRCKIRTAPANERFRLLRYFGNEIRVLAPGVARETGEKWDLGASSELAPAQGAVMGGWWTADPSNPTWPGRDRMFLARREDLLTTCCGLAILGFFPVDQVAAVLEAALVAGREATIPGLEVPGYAPEELPYLVWESAVESARSKRRWRDSLGQESVRRWADPDWAKSPAVWRTFTILDVETPGLDSFRALASRGGETMAGLALLIIVPRDEAATLAEQWDAAGWDTVVVSRTDYLGLYDTLAAIPGDKPLAIMQSIGSSPLSSSSRTARRHKEPELLGELSDEQFHAIMGETMRF